MSAARTAAAVSSGALLALAQPNWGLWPLAFVCLVPLLFAVRGVGPWSRAGLGWIAGFVASLLGCVAQGAAAAEGFFELPAWQAWLASIAAAQIFGSLPFAVFAVLAPANGSGTLAAPLRTSAAWITSEAIRCTILGGLPWMLLGYALAPVPEWIGPARWGGVLLVSGWVALVNGSWVMGRATGFAFGLVVLILLRTAAPAAFVKSDAPPFRVRIIHTGHPTPRRPAATAIAKVLERLRELSRGTTADLIVWPENAVPAVMPANLARVRALRDDTAANASLLFGATHVTAGKRPRLFTSAVLLPIEGELRMYDKRVRIPFFEYSPWPLAANEAGGNISAGSSARSLPTGGIRLAPLICYEALFPEHARHGALDGADVLVHLSNEAWFGPTRGADQLLAAAVFRAVETGRPVLRSTNAGVSGLIHPDGRVAVRREGAAGIIDTEIHPVAETPLALAIGTGWWWFAATAAIAGFVVECRRPT